MGTLEQSEQAGPPRAGGRNQRSLKGLLINRRFQLKYTLIVVFVSVVIATVLGILLYHRVSENTTLILDNLRGMGANAEYLKQSEVALLGRDREVVLFLVLCLVGLVLAIAVLGIYVTHKVAGPLFMMSRYLEDIASGTYRPMRELRKGDDLVEFHQVLRETLSSIQEREKDDIATLEASIRALRDQLERLTALGEPAVPMVDEVNRAVEALAALKTRKQEALG